MLRPVTMVAALAAMSCSGQNTVGNETNAAGPAFALQPGLWEMRPVITLSPTAERRQMPTEVVTRWCISEAEAPYPGLPNPNSSFFEPGSVYYQCSNDLNYAAGRIQGRRECFSTDQGRYGNNVTGRYTPTSFEIEEVVGSETAEGRSEAARIRSTGRRIGDCPRDMSVAAPKQANESASQATPAR